MSFLTLFESKDVRGLLTYDLVRERCDIGPRVITPWRYESPQKKGPFHKTPVVRNYTEEFGSTLFPFLFFNSSSPPFLSLFHSSWLSLSLSLTLSLCVCLFLFIFSSFCFPKTENSETFSHTRLSNMLVCYFVTRGGVVYLLKTMRDWNKEIK